MIDNTFQNPTSEAQLERLYRDELRRAVQAVRALLPSYRARVDGATYRNDRITFEALAARADDPTLSTVELELLLQALSWQESLMAQAGTSPKGDAFARYLRTTLQRGTRA